jgi:hypothetical protein
MPHHFGNLQVKEITHLNLNKQVRATILSRLYDLK